MDLSSAKETFSHHLKEKNLRVTKERMTLLEEIMKSKGHFDSEELYDRIRSKGLKVSRATVYNTLNVLVECGLISKYRFGENHSRYEKAFGRPRHDHLICLECGDIIEFVNEKLDAIQKEVCEQNKFKWHNSTLQIFGICAKCQQRKK